MFWKRFITAIILVPLVLFTIFYAQPWFWLQFGLLITLLAVSEYWQLIPATTPFARVSFLVLMFLAIAACAIWFTYWQILGLGLWLLICIALVSFPASQRYWGHPSIIAAINLVFWPLFVLSVAGIYTLPQGRELLVYLLFLVWSADTGAYLLGKLVGKHKLIPKVSPGKSWEGVIGGLALGLIVSYFAYLYFMPKVLLPWLVIALVTLISTVVGDLCISIFKRHAHLKDTGDLIPGHGGILDRLDSIIAAAPVFYVGLWMLTVYF